jgi:F0F1-type ATP synthase assembly protein I
MLGFMLAHGGDASGLGMLAFLPIGLLLAIGIYIVLRPALTGTGLSSTDGDDDPARDPEQDLERKPDEGRG